MADRDPAVLAIQQALYRVGENIEASERTTRARVHLVNKAKTALSKAESEHRRAAEVLAEYRTERDSLTRSLSILERSSEDGDRS